MVNRTRDIVHLREAARRCRSTAAAADGARAETFIKLAAEIDGLIAKLLAEIEAAAAARACRETIGNVAVRAAPVRALAG